MKIFKHLQLLILLVLSAVISGCIAPEFYLRTDMSSAKTDLKIAAILPLSGKTVRRQNKWRKV